MIPPFVNSRGVPYGILAPGIHVANLDEVRARFAQTTHRAWLFEGIVEVAMALKTAGCTKFYLDGSYVTGKEHPNDYDGCWDPVGVNPAQLDPVLLDFSNGRAAQKQKYRGEMFISSGANDSNATFLEFFQVEKLTGARKGLVCVNLANERNWQP
jgi:hypothetical protein